jgi:bifunctional DNase/RNase
MDRKKVRLNILGLSYSQTQSGAYALILTEENGDRRIPIIIGGVEAQAIAIRLEGLTPPRPLTHDLFMSLAQAFGIELVEVVMYKLEEGIFYSELVCKKESGEVVRIDSRTSDAVALALRFNCPIYTYEDIIQKAGIVIDFDHIEEAKTSRKSKKKESDYGSYSLDELQQMLQSAIEKEDYEKASAIRDEINTRDQK